MAEPAGSAPLCASCRTYDDNRRTCEDSRMRGPPLRNRPIGPENGRQDDESSDSSNDSGGDDESTSQLARGSIDVVGLYQQQRSLAAAEDDRGRTSELGNDGGVPGRNQAALQLIGAG
jgi:hypothetical protein